MRLVTMQILLAFGLSLLFLFTILLTLFLTPSAAAAQACFDSDSGTDYSRAGQVTLADGTIYSDTCSRSGQLVEYFCVGDQSMSSVILCNEFGENQSCLGGRCQYVDFEKLEKERTINPVYGLLLLSALAVATVLVAFLLYLWWEKRHPRTTTNSTTSQAAHPSLAGITFMQKQLLALLMRHDRGILYSRLPEMLRTERTPLTHAVEDLYNRKLLTYVKKGKDALLILLPEARRIVGNYLAS